MFILGAVVLGSLSACNRVPGNKVALVSASDKMVTDRQTALENAAAEEEEALMPMCTRACGHWVSLRFPDPVGLNRVTPDELVMVNELLDQQRAVNRAECEEACSDGGDHRRARCVLRAMTVDESEACALR